MIPKIILHKSTNPIPVHVQNKIKYLCNFEYQYHNIINDDVEEFFAKNKHVQFPNMIERYNFLFKEANPCLATDFFRYYFLYLFGGVVLDADAMIQVKIDEIVQDFDFFTARSNHGSMALPGFLGASKENPLILKVLQNLYHNDVHLYNTMNKQYVCAELLSEFFNFETNKKYKLYDEVWGFPDDIDGEFRTWDNDKVIMIHYGKTKIIPENHKNIPS
jgi:mannosyltransferase OCH1-like enzyme